MLISSQHCMYSWRVHNASGDKHGSAHEIVYDISLGLCIQETQKGRSEFFCGSDAGFLNFNHRENCLRGFS